jgi:hypothetical protein
MTKKKPNTEFEIGITKVKELGFSLDESAAIGSKQLHMNLQVQFSYDLPNNSIVLQLSVAFMNDANLPISRVEVANHFIMANLKQYINPKHSDVLQIPEEAMTLLLSISYSHARALLARHLNGTSLESLVLPIISPSQVLKDLNIEVKDVSVKVTPSNTKSSRKTQGK